MALEVIYCLCGQSSDVSRFMIQCDFCKNYFHGRCVGVREYQAVDIDRFHCPRCEPYHGPSVLKARLNWHRHDYSEADAANKAVQTGTQVFITELRNRHFHSGEKVITRLQGADLNLAYIAGDDAGGGGGGEKGGGREDGVAPPTGGFTQPILVEDKEGLDMVLPHTSFSVVDVESYVGSEHKVDVIDVQRQTDVTMRLHEFIEYFLSPARTTVLNLISLEFSGTSLSQLVEPPSIVRQMCWVTNAWPSDPPPSPPLSRPSVSKYCLVSVENSYTDFHIDFGGSSVWYHVLWGQKVFYLIKPTPANLVLYQRWLKASNQSEMFFADQVDACYKCEVKAGETLFIPAGWIHSVLTPTDTLVFGGNFLHSYNIDLQMRVYELEQATFTVPKFQFPFFPELCWYAARHVLQQLRGAGASPASLLHGARTLYASLRQWAHQGGRGGVAAHVPEGVSAAKLLKEMQRELRSTEKQAVALNPPRPERESKRRKKKHLAEDFVDYTNLMSFHSALEERLPKRENEEDDSDYQDDKHCIDQQIKQDTSNQQILDHQHINLVQKLSPDSQQHIQDTHMLQDPTQQQQLQSLTSIQAEPPQSQHLEQQLQQQQPSEGTAVKLSLPRPTSSYHYSLLGSADYGMSGTPPHDPEYSAYQTEYPTNVKTDFEWAESSGVTPYRLARTSSLSPVGAAGLPLAHAATTSFRTHPASVRLKIGRSSVDSSTSNGGEGVPGAYAHEGAMEGVVEEGCDDDDRDDTGGLMIDESPARGRRMGRGGRLHPLKMKLTFSPTGVVETTEGEVVYGSNAVEVGGEVEVAPAAHHNGIEELLRASAYARADYPGSQQQQGALYPPLQQHNTYRAMDEIDGSGRASPSTRDAIAGMLSMSRDVAATSQHGVHGGSPAAASRRQQPRSGGAAGCVMPSQYPRPRPTVATVLSKAQPRRYLEEESIKKVHQDEDYVYPTLDHSDEEDFPIFKPRGKKKEDEAWNPKARVRVWGPRPERPARLGVKRQAVEKGLEVAANRRNAQPVAKRAYHRKKARGGGMAGTASSSPSLGPPITSLQPGTSAHHLPASGTHHPAHSTLPSPAASPATHSTHSTTHHHRPKKGMATAKQRLGRILKIHKMIY